MNISWINKLLSGPGPEELAARELTEAKKSLLMAQTGEEFARSQVEYNKARIARLEGFLRNLSTTKTLTQ